MGQAIQTVGAVTQIYGQQKQLKAQKNAAQASANETALANRRQQLETIRQARINKANLLQTAAGVGTVTSSTTAGAAASIDTQQQSNLGELAGQAKNQMLGLKAQRQGFAGQEIENIGSGMIKLGGMMSSTGGGSAEKLRKAQEG